MLGVCQFEVIAIQSLLASMEIVSVPLSLDKNNAHITELDIVVLCLSAPRELGWAKYLSLVKSVYDGVAAKVIVLTPEHIPTTLFIDDRVRFLCGKLPSKILLTYLLDMIRRFYVGYRRDAWRFYGTFRYWVLKDLIEDLPIFIRAARQGLNAKTVFAHRLSMVKSLGFLSYHRMRICFAGSDEQTIMLLRKRVL